MNHPETLPEERNIRGHTPAFRVYGSEVKVSIAAQPGQTRKYAKPPTNPHHRASAISLSKHGVSALRNLRSPLLGGHVARVPCE